jgi:hypothetical protein
MRKPVATLLVACAVLLAGPAPPLMQPRLDPQLKIVDTRGVLLGVEAEDESAGDGTALAGSPSPAQS